MAKKKPAAKMPVKKPVAKSAGKKPAMKAAPKKDVKMAKKAAPKKVEKKAAKAAPKSSMLKTAGKLIQKVLPKGMSKEQLKKLQAKEKALAAKEKALAAKEAQKAKALAAKEAQKTKALQAKEKAKAQADKAKAKELEKKKKEEEKLSAKAAKEAAKMAEKAAKKKAKGGDADEEEAEFGAAPKKASEDDDFDEFEEDYKKSKAKKSGKKAYDTDEVHVDDFTPKTSKKYNNALLADLENKIADEIAELREHFNWRDIAEAIGTMDFFIDPKNDECIEKGCDNIRTTQSYCRLHYLRNWKTVQKKRDILKEGKLQEYIEELISKYPPKFIEALLSDLSDDKEFYKILNELNITSEFDFEEDEFENAVDDDDDDTDIGIETISSSLRYEDE